MSDFVHLHVHSEFSLLDGSCKIKDLIHYCQQHQLKHIALTDNAVMFGAIDFYMAAKSAGINAIVGCELYFTPELATKEKRNTRIIALCQNNTGYNNLCKMVSSSHTEHFYYKARVDYELLNTYKEGLIFISPGQNGPIADLIQKDQLLEAEKVAEKFLSIFGDKFYLGLQKTQEHAEIFCQKIASLADQLCIPLVATNDVYYKLEEDNILRQILQSIQFGRVLEEDDQINQQKGPHYLKSPQEMNTLFKDYPEALSNTLKIAKDCHIEFELDRVLLPNFACPDNLSADAYLEKLVWEGIQERYSEITQDLTDRINFELNTIKNMHFSIYFLIIHDFLAYCYAENIPVGPGRGSAAGSIVAYALGITALDPIPYNLLFERFLNPDRVSMPDIDLDFCINRRQEVIDYITFKYGQEHVAQIITFGTMQARAVVRDVGRVFNIPLNQVDRLAKLIPAAPGHYTSIEEALETVPELKQAYDSDPDTKKLLDFGSKLEGISRHSSTHAAGVVISKDPLAHVVPLTQNDGQASTQYSMAILEKLGLLKMDILGLRNLTVIDNTLALIKKIHNKDIDLNALEKTDTTTYKHLTEGNTLGIFQLESPGMRKLIKELKPSCFEDLVALLALYRPGPLGSGMVDTFISNKAGTTEVTYQLDVLEPILKDTYGLILYQEQVMQIASAVGGFSLAQADMLRRAMGKKKKDVMDEMKLDFLAGAKQKEFPVKIAENIFELCYKFSEYGFNKSHSAAYAMISYQTAYLKCHYPSEYLSSLLSSVSGNSEKIAEYVMEARRMGIEIIAPSVQSSEAMFICQDKSIYFGLSAIKNVGEGAIESIVKTRKEEGPYESIEDFFLKVDLRQVNKRVLENLIYAGAFDALDTNKNALIQNYEKLLEQAQIEAKNRASGQSSLFDAMGVSPFEYSAKANTATSFSELELCHLEKEAIGIYLSQHPIDLLPEGLRNKYHSIGGLTKDNDNTFVSCLGLLTQVRRGLTKTGKQMIAGILQDQQSQLEVVSFFEDENDPISQTLLANHILVATGRLRFQSDRKSMIIQSAQLIDLTQSQEHIHIDLETLNPQEIDSIRKILLENSGDLPSYIHFAQHVILSHRKFWSNKEVLEMLQEKYGHQRIWLGYAKDKSHQMA